MGDRVVYEWLALRVVPRVGRGEFVNVGVVLYAGAHAFLDAAVDLDENRLRALDPAVDVATVRHHLDAIVALCAGDPAAGDNAARPPRERFRWLAAPRSTVLQPSPVHGGLTADPEAELAHLLATMVTLPDAD